MIPKNIDAEQSLIGSILLNPDCFEELRITAESFYENRHKIIFLSMSTIFERGQSIDLVTVRAEIDSKEELNNVGGHIYLAELTNIVPSSANWESYQDLVIKSHQERFLQKFSETISLKIGKENPEDLMEFIQTYAVKMTPSNLWDIETMDKVKEKRLQHYRDLQSGLIERIDYGLGLPKFLENELVILGARPSQGKTAMSLNMAINCKRKVLYFSLEQASGQIFDRLASSCLDINLSKIVYGTINKQEMERIKEFKSNITVVDKNMTVKEIGSVIKKHKMQYWVETVFIDYLERIKRPGKRNKHEEIGDITGSLKDFAKEFNIPIVCLAQLSRSVDQRVGGIPLLSDLKDSGNIEQDADVILLIQKDKDVDNPFASNTILHIGKNRNWPTGQIELDFIPHTVTFKKINKCIN